MQFRDLQTQYQKLKPDIDAAINQVLTKGNFILGEEVRLIEQELAAYVGVKHCVTCANATDALTLALMVNGVGKGDAVFVPDFTFFATSGCASILGATPVFVDIDINSFNISPDSLKAAIERTIKEGKLTPKVIIPVDLFGLPADYDSINAIAKEYGLLVLEDGAQGFGGAIGNKKACSFGDIAITSFFPAKPLGCYGDGGAIFTNSDEIRERLYSLKRQGASPTDKYDNREIGMNSRLDTLQAAILRVKLKAFEDYEMQAVNDAATAYEERLKANADIITPKVPDGFYSSWAQYSVLLPSREIRSKVQERLKAHGIPSMIYYPRGLHQQSAYKWMGLSDEDFPNTVKVVERVLSLPMGAYIGEEDVDFVCRIINSSFRKDT